MTDIAAAIGIHQLKKIYKFQEMREAIAQIYNIITYVYEYQCKKTVS